ncbi:MAG: hypothetical protein QOD59_231 [Mycobacterium sp.]|nr:hypothetical protein [Mycobacterium sp.]
MTEDDPLDLAAKVRNSLRKSGYPLELRVVAVLEKANPKYSHHSRYFVDPRTEKVREIDVVACWQVRNSFAYLVAECKSKPAPWVVFSSSLVSDCPELLQLLYTWEFYDEPRLQAVVEAPDFRADSTFLQAVQVGTSIVEVKFGKEKDSDPYRNDSAYDAVRAAMSAVEGFRNDVDEEAMRGLESVSVIALPVAVTSGSLFRGWLDDDGDIAIEETDLAFVTVRLGMETIPKLCAVTTEKGLPRLAAQARCTAQALSRKPL